MDFALVVAALATAGGIALSPLVERMLREIVLRILGESLAPRAASASAQKAGHDLHAE